MGAQSATVNLHRESRWEEMSALELEYDDEDDRGESTHDCLIMYINYVSCMVVEPPKQ